MFVHISFTCPSSLCLQNRLLWICTVLILPDRAAQSPFPKLIWISKDQTKISAQYNKYLNLLLALPAFPLFVRFVHTIPPDILSRKGRGFVLRQCTWISRFSLCKNTFIATHLNTERGTSISYSCLRFSSCSSCCTNPFLNLCVRTQKKAIRHTFCWIKQVGWWPDNLPP